MHAQCGIWRSVSFHAGVLNGVLDIIAGVHASPCQRQQDLAATTLMTALCRVIAIQMRTMQATKQGQGGGRGWGEAMGGPGLPRCTPPPGAPW